MVPFCGRQRCICTQVRRSGGAILWQAEVHLHTVVLFCGRQRCICTQVRRSGGAILWQAEVHLHTGEAVRWCHSVAGRGASAHR